VSIGYYDGWEDEDVSCSDCSWHGKGKDCSQGEMYRELFGLDCPECGEEITVIPFPTFAESRANWEKVSEVDKMMIELAEKRREDFLSRSLHSPDQLPNIDGDDLILVWDVDGSPSDGNVLIKHGKDIIWREPSSFENYRRFEEVVNILKEKYGDCLQDLVPTRKSYLDLYGDCLGSPNALASVRKRISNQY